jgi:integrase
MSVDLRVTASDYLAGRRARGYRLEDHDRTICAFVDGLDGSPVTIADVLAFAQDRPDSSHERAARRFEVVRGFVNYLHMRYPSAAEPVPPGLIPRSQTRKMPFLYTDEEVVRLLKRTSRLPSPVLAATMRTLIGLLAVSGMRSGEAVNLDVEHVDWERRALLVTSKGRQRLVPFHESTAHALEDYMQVRATKAPPTGAVFVGKAGRRHNQIYAERTFRRLVEECRLDPRPAGTPARLHDLRHSFAVRTLVDAVRNGKDVDATVAVLADFLGHVDATCTYWYLTVSPELVAAMSERMAAFQRRPLL